MGKLKETIIEEQMKPAVPATMKPTSVPQVGSRNAFAIYGESAGGSHIVGELLKFSKGDWLAGQDAREIPEGLELVAGMETLAVGWQCWKDQRPVEQRIGLIVDGFTPPKREELGNTDESLWEHDDDGKPRDPWQLTNYLQLLDPKDPDKVFTFTTSSRGWLERDRQALARIRPRCREGRSRGPIPARPPHHRFLPAP